MTFRSMNHGPMIDADEAKLRQLDQLIADAKRAEREEAERKAEEARRRAEREAQAPSYTLADLERMRAELAAQIAQRQHHLQLEAERDALRRRAEQLSAEIEIGETRLQDMRAQRDALMAKLG